MKINNELIIYTDGASKDNPRRGGIGIRFIIPDFKNGTEKYYDFNEGSFVGASNNEMELYACIVALEMSLKEDLSRLRKLTICVDSNYVFKNIYNAKYIWPKNNWLSSEGTPLENVKHWEHLLRVMNKFRININFEKVKAHVKGKNKDLHNDKVDKLATEARDWVIKIPFNIINARKKYSKNQAKKGCVKITDNQISIRIITCTGYKKHKDLFKYKYVVISEENQCYSMLDWVYYNLRLHEGHSYIVIMVLRNKIPFIKKILADITKNSRLDLS